MHLLRGLLVALAAVGGLCILPASGAASALPPGAVPWVAQYTLDVKDGSQHGSWTEHHQPVPPCDGGETGSGSQDVTLSPHGTTPVFASGVGPILTSLLIAAPADIPAPGDPSSVPQALIYASAAISREGSVQDGTPQDPTGCPSGDGGTSAPPQPDCGSRSAVLSLWFEQQSNILHFEQPDGSTPDTPYMDCPFLGPGAFPQWTAMDIPLPQSGWGPGPPVGTALPTGVELSGQASDAQHDADIDEDTSEQLTLRFSPLFVAPTIALGDVSSEKLTPDGTIGVPVTCPSKERPGCSGTVSLGIDPSIATGASAAAFTAPTLAKASFKLRPGTRTRLKLRFAHPSRQYLRALAQAPLVLIVTVGTRHPIRYVAAHTQLRF